MKTKHDNLLRAIRLWEQHPHRSHSDVSLRGFIGVYQAVSEVLNEEIARLNQENNELREIMKSMEEH